MANYLSGSRAEYTRGFGGFRGVDFSSEYNQVEDGRFTHLQNMWRDYESGQGDAVETVPGYRELARFGGRINGIFRYRTRDGEDFVVVHAGKRLYRFLHGDRDVLMEGEKLAACVSSFDGMEDAPSSAFIFADKLYILDGVHYYRLDSQGLVKVSDVAYVPTTYIDGVEYEQRNMLTNLAYETTNKADAPTEIDDTNLIAKQGTVHKSQLSDIGINETTVIANLKQDYVWSSEVNQGHGESSLDYPGLQGCKNLKVINFTSDFRSPTLAGFEFEGCDSLTDIYINHHEATAENLAKIAVGAIPDGVTVHWNETYDTSGYYFPATDEKCCVVPLFGKVEEILGCRADGEAIPYNAIFEQELEEQGKNYYIRKVIFAQEHEGKKIEVSMRMHSSTFKSVGEYLDFFTGNPEYKGTTKDAINRCTVQCHFDGRLFFTGNPTLPNTIFYTQRDLTGYNNPAYVGVLNYMNDGVGNTPNTAMAASSGTLMVFKADTAQDGSVYYHTGTDTGNNLVPRIYPSTAGVPGIGCLGAAVNFYDDICFLSRRGLEAIGKQTVNLERTVEHRSSNVDKHLIAEDLSAARFAEWCGYLVILCGSRAYLADHRQIFTHATGVRQYEWYFMDDLCSYSDTRKVYVGTEELPFVEVGGELVSLGDFAFPDGAHLLPCGSTDMIDRDAEAVYSGDIRYEGESGTRVLHVSYVNRGGAPYYIEPTGELQGIGQASPASALCCVDEVLYFGMEDGTLVCMNNDKRGRPYLLPSGYEVAVESDQIYRAWYTHAGRRYLSGFATAADNAGYPHLLKSTVKKSMVLKMKALSGGGFRVMSCTDRTEWRQVQRTGGALGQVITSDARGFDDVDFGAVNYNGRGGITVPIMEKEKKWVEKQLYLYSDGYAQPFGIFSLAYRFYLTGRIKK